MATVMRRKFRENVLVRPASLSMRIRMATFGRLYAITVKALSVSLKLLSHSKHELTISICVQLDHLNKLLSPPNLGGHRHPWPSKAKADRSLNKGRCNKA